MFCTTWFDVKGTVVQPVTRVGAESMVMSTQLPLPDTAEVRVIVPEVVVIFTLNDLPDKVATTVPGACLGPISYFSRSALTSFLRHSHCALVEMMVPSCMANGLGNFLLSADSKAPADELQLAPAFSGEPPATAPPAPPLPAPAPPVAVVPPADEPP